MKLSQLYFKVKSSTRWPYAELCYCYYSHETQVDRCAFMEGAVLVEYALFLVRAMLLGNFGEATVEKQVYFYCI